MEKIVQASSKKPIHQQHVSYSLLTESENLAQHVMGPVDACFGVIASKARLHFVDYWASSSQSCRRLHSTAIYRIQLATRRCANTHTARITQGFGPTVQTSLPNTTGFQFMPLVYRVWGTTLEAYQTQSETPYKAKKYRRAGKRCRWSGVGQARTDLQGYQGVSKAYWSSRWTL